MKCKKISNNFYKLEHVLSIDLFEEILENFIDTSQWSELPDANNINRLELNLNINSNLSKRISAELDPIKEIAEYNVGKLYPNAPQLWFDNNNYISQLHKDFSPNIVVNIQLYLADGFEQMGTTCFDNGWHKVPYKKNFGYMLLYPTKIMHGMDTPTLDSRISVYQSYRSTIDPIDVW